MPNLETLVLGSSAELNTPMLPTKFLNLKHLIIQISVATLPPSYDYFSLVSFLDASPSLETWYLEVYPEDMEHESVFEGSSDLRQLPEYRHDNLKSVEIIGFISARSLIELTCCIVKSAVSSDSHWIPFGVVVGVLGEIVVIARIKFALLLARLWSRKPLEGWRR